MHAGTGVTPPQSHPADHAPGDASIISKLLLLSAVCALFLLVQYWPAINTLQLPDTDDNLRLVQIRDWLGGQGWFDLRQYRLDPPEGADIHWTRLVDIPYALLISLFAPFTGMMLAEKIATATVPLLILGATIATFAAIARRAIGPSAWGWPAVLLMMASPVVQMMSPLRIDHHGAQLLMLALMLWGLMAPHALRGGLIAGSALSTSLVIGVEMLPYLAIGAGCAVIFWIIDAREQARVRGLAIGIALVTTLGLWLFIPPRGRMSGLCDQLTNAYFPAVLAGSAALLAVSLLRARHWGTRAALATLAGSVALAAMFASGGVDCITDPYRAIDPVARRLWLNGVNEAAPLWLHDRETAYSMLAFPLIGLGGALWCWWHSRDERRRAWAVILLIGGASIILCTLSIRAGIPAQLFAIPGAAALMAAGRARLVASPSVLVRIFGTVALLGLVSGVVARLIIVQLTHKVETKVVQQREINADACKHPDSIAALNVLPPANFMTAIDLAPMLLVHSHHRAVAGPYHRNGKAIAATMIAFTGRDDIARAFIRAHHINYILICPGLDEHEIYKFRAPHGFQQRLLAGKGPSWLTPVRNHPAFRLYRVE